MPYPDLLRAYFDRSDAIQNLWTLYVVVIGGLLAASTLRRRPDAVKVAIVSALYVGFAYKNVTAIGEATAERAVVLHAMEAPPPDAAPFARDLRPALDPTPYTAARNFHVGCDVLTLAAVWAMEARRRRPGSQLLA